MAVGLACLAVLAAGCGADPANREYLAALRGEETGMTRQEQIAHLDRAIEMAPERAHYYETRATYEIDLRRFNRARDDLDRDLEFQDRPYARFLRGLVKCQAGEAAASLEDFDDAIAREPANTQFYRGRSLARAATGDAPGALRDAEHLVAAAPQQGESFYARGIAQMRLGRAREAIADFDRAAALKPELVYVVEALAEAHEQLGDSAQVRLDREAIIRLRHEHGRCGYCFDPFRY